MKNRALLATAVCFLLFSCAGKTDPIKDEKGIASLEKVKLGGVEQWILIRGEDAANPVMLFVHGGPGSPEMAMHSVFGPYLENNFTVVHWDQRGAGKSFSLAVPARSMNVDQFVSDAHELAALLCERFGQEKIFIVGHSWGSLLGALTVHKYPELFHAYVGIGQVVDLQRNEAISYQYVLDEAQKRKNYLALAQLKTIGPPPYSNDLELGIQRRWLERFGGATKDPDRMDAIMETAFAAPEYTPGEKLGYLNGTLFSILLMWDEVMTYNLIDQVPRLEVPVYFFEGRYDYNTPWELVQEYYDKLDAPQGKKLIWFENSAHSPNLEEPERFGEEMGKVKDEVMAKE